MPLPLPQATPQIVEVMDPRRIAQLRAAGVPEIQKPNLFQRLGGKFESFSNRVGDKLSNLSDNERAGVKAFGFGLLANRDQDFLQAVGNAGLNAQQFTQTLDYRDQLQTLRELQQLRLLQNQNRPRLQQFTKVLPDGRHQKGFIDPLTGEDSFQPVGSPFTPGSIGKDLGDALGPHLRPDTQSDLEGEVLSQSQGVTQLQDLIKSIEENPGSVGIIGSARETIGGVVGQIFPAAGEAISPDSLVETRTKMRTVIAPLISTITGDTSGRYSDRDIQMTREASRALDNASNAQQAGTALSTILQVMEGSLDRNQDLLGAGSALGNLEPMGRTEAEAFLRENDTPENREFFADIYGQQALEAILGRGQ